MAPDAVSDISAYALTEDELFKITRYKRPSNQMEVLKRLGIPAELLRDNTVRVLRRNLLQPAPMPLAPIVARPKLKLA